MTMNNQLRKDEMEKPTKPIPGALNIHFLNEMSKVMAYGAAKYDRDNWKEASATQRIYYVDAAFRHLFAFLMGETKDKESGLHHLAHLACNIMFLYYFDKKEKSNGKKRLNNI